MNFLFACPNCANSPGSGDQTFLIVFIFILCTYFPISYCFYLLKKFK